MLPCSCQCGPRVVPNSCGENRYWFGWGELWGIANRGSYDLERHTEGSGLDLRFKDPTTQEVCSAVHQSAPITRSQRTTVAQSQYPHVVEPAIGLGRLLLAVLNEAYTEEVWEGKSAFGLVEIVPLVDHDPFGGSLADGKTLSRNLLKFHERFAPVSATVRF